MSSAENMFLGFQTNEITEHHIYAKLAEATKNESNRQVLKKISEDEKRHYEFWKKHTGKDVKPNGWQIFKYYWIAKIFGLTFGVKLMEIGEEGAQNTYANVSQTVPDVKHIIEDENAHEQALLGMLQEERLRYIGAIVLGLNDALVELTGALAGLSFALQNTKLVAVAGLITGIAASFSMGASAYLSTKAEPNGKNALKSSLYTGFAYLVTVAFLILPFLLISNYATSLLISMGVAIVIIWFFNFYISVARDLSFKKRFLEMAGLSLGIAAITFGIGYLVRKFVGVEI